MRCMECRHEWTPPPYRCPQCGAEAPSVLPRFDPRPLNDKAFMALMIVFATFIAIQFTVYATFLPMLSLVLAVLGLVEIKQSKGRMAGSGHAVIVIVISLFFLLAGLPGLLRLFR